jgi:hypothetical protein
MAEIRLVPSGDWIPPYMALKHFPWKHIRRMMEPDVIDEVVKTLSDETRNEFLQRYLELAEDDLYLNENQWI